jgi:hypothetical protein
MPTLNGISFKILDEGFSKGVDQGGPFYRCLFMIEDWDSSDAFCNSLMGFGTSTGPITGITVTRGVPYAFPTSPNLFCVSATVVQGLGKLTTNAESLPGYDAGALIAVEFRPPPWNFSGADNPNHNFDPATPIAWASQELSFSSQSFTLPNSKLKFTATNDPTDVYVKFEIPITIMTLTYHKLPYLPMGVVSNLSGRVNSGTFLGKPAETVLFKGCTSSREFNTDGTVVQRITLTFESRHADHPWNSLPSGDDPTFRPVSGLGGVKMYKTADLSPLVQF